LPVWLGFLLSEQGIALVVMAVGFGWGLVKTKTKLKDDKWAKIVAVGEEAVNEVYTEFVYGLKKKRKSGKLTSEEAKEARDMAWEKMKSIGQEKGLDMVKELAGKYIPVLINKLVKSAKK